MDYIDQTPEALRYHLFDRATNVDDLQIIDEATIDLGRFKLRFAIIGESHFFVLTRKSDWQVMFSEVLGCVADFPFNGQAVNHFSYDDLLKRQESEEGFVPEVDFVFEGGKYVATFDITLFPRERTFIDGRKSVYSLSRVFPGHHQPATTVEIEVISSEKIQLNTFHEYPNDDGIGVVFQSSAMILLVSNP